jgi:hypothetical protein
MRWILMFFHNFFILLQHIILIALTELTVPFEAFKGDLRGMGHLFLGEDERSVRGGGQVCLKRGYLIRFLGEEEGGGRSAEKDGEGSGERIGGRGREKRGGRGNG